MYHVLLFYKLRKIKNPKKQVELQKHVCSALKLKGRILINEQGINGTVGGTRQSIEMYKDYMDSQRIFKNIDFKESTAKENPFPKMKIKLRKEIITTKAKDKIDLDKRGNHVDRDTFHEWLTSGEEIVLLDMRNDYEWEVGRFKGAVKPPMKFFRDLKDSMDFYEKYKGKKIVMFCTGGIRCEPASAYFIEKGFDPENVYQLEGGIVKYVEKYGNEGLFEGKCFVFDDRLVIPVCDKENEKIVSNCEMCDEKCATFINCANKKTCNKLFICCDACSEENNGTCSSACMEKIKNLQKVKTAG